MEEDLRYHYVGEEKQYKHPGEGASCFDKQCRDNPQPTITPETERDKKIIRDIRKELGK